MTRKRISTGSEFEEQIGYSRAVVDEHYVFVSGTTGYDYSDMTISDDVVKQAEQCFRNIAACLEESGSSIKNIVRIRYILSARDDFEKCWPVFRRWLGDVKPAATMWIADRNLKCVYFEQKCCV